MKQTSITSGKFAEGANQKGNFTGYNAKGERIFIHKNQMESLGWKAQKDVKFPFFAVIDTREIQTRDENGDLSNPAVMVKRLQALSVFATDTAMINAVNADQLLDIKAKAALQAEAKTAGLSEAQVNALITASV